MNEDAIIRKLRRRAPLIGDDCAIIRPPKNHDLLFTTDFSTEGVHFTRKSPPEDIGHRALARSLSDIAAMGGAPLYCLISLALAPWSTEEWIDAFYDGIFRLLHKTNTQLAGGDISHANRLVCDVMVCGAVPARKALKRSGAKPGNILYVSGPLGGWKNKRLIIPRLDIGRKLLGKATSCMDISDGLALDLHRLCLASSVAAEIDDIPLLKSATLAQALHDGEDYELLYTAPLRTRVPGIRIGTITKGKPGALRYRGEPIKPIGYDHIQHRS